MNDRTQEELRELANKYNGAVNEIKEFADKLKVSLNIYILELKGILKLPSSCIEIFFVLF